MNAKKIMGAVLVALLAAALFVGAGAAYSAGETVFTYQYLGDGSYDGTWTYAGADTTATGSFTIDSTAKYIANENLPVGKYENDNGVDYIYLAKPNGIIAATAGGASIIDGTVPAGEVVSFTKFVEAGVDAIVLLTSPAGVQYKVSTGTFTPNVEGEWTAQVAFVLGDATGKLVLATPVKYQVGEAYKFTVGESGVSVKINVDSVVEGAEFLVTVTGMPGATYDIEFDSELMIDPLWENEYNFPTGKITLNNAGTLTIPFVGTDVGSFEIKVDSKKASIEIIEGEITAVAEKDSYFIGDPVKITGTSTGANTLYFAVEGSNYVVFQQVVTEDNSISVTVKNDDTWEAELDLDKIKLGGYLPDAGTYTVYVGSLPAGMTQVFSKDDFVSYTTVSVALKQPFLTAELQASVVAQGSDLVVTGNAEATSDVVYYIFGNNFFDLDLEQVKESVYKIKYEIPNDMDAGQYFLVVQHPMYDTYYNIAPNVTNGEIIFYLNTTSYGAALGEGSPLFKLFDRQTSNAAEALCKALDTQNIDDIYVKATFIVAAPSATMNPVPSEVAKGTKLVVSGTTNLAPGSTISVQMLSTAFTAVPKEATNSASFIALTTKVADDGTWEVTFDTTGLNIDEYTITATAGQFVSTAKVNVVEKAPVTPEQPDTPVTPEQPEQPEQPTEPETPGFGALAALAGLGAVAVLLLRRE